MIVVSYKLTVIVHYQYSYSRDHCNVAYLDAVKVSAHVPHSPPGVRVMDPQCFLLYVDNLCSYMADTKHISLCKQSMIWVGFYTLPVL